jgi:hypothetical protein
MVQKNVRIIQGFPSGEPSQMARVRSSCKAHMPTSNAHRSTALGNLYATNPDCARQSNIGNGDIHQCGIAGALKC